MLIATCLALVLLAAAIAAWPLWVRWRRQRIAGRPFPAHWRGLLRRHVPLVSRLPARQQLRLKALMQVFLAEKPIIGCRGLRVTDEMRVTIAALACLPLLGALNVSVSFYLAFRLALRAQNVSVKDRARIYAAIRARLRSAPLSFFRPARQTA